MTEGDNQVLPAQLAHPATQHATRPSPLCPLNRSGHPAHRAHWAGSGPTGAGPVPSSHSACRKPGAIEQGPAVVRVQPFSLRTRLPVPARKTHRRGPSQQSVFHSDPVPPCGPQTRAAPAPQPDRPRCPAQPQAWAWRNGTCAGPPHRGSQRQCQLMLQSLRLPCWTPRPPTHPWASPTLSTPLPQAKAPDPGEQVMSTGSRLANAASSKWVRGRAPGTAGTQQQAWPVAPRAILATLSPTGQPAQASTSHTHCYFLAALQAA